jgi:hypothetical protein
MADPTQFSFDLRDVATALIKQQGIRDGSWLLGFEFQVGVGTWGPNPTEAKPGAMLQIAKLTLARRDPNMPAELAVDAAEVNPAPQRGKKVRPG